MREFDLQFAFATARALREDIEDHHRAIDDRKRDRAFEIGPLTRPQIVEDENLRRAEFGRALRDLRRLPAPDERARIDTI